MSSHQHRFLIRLSRLRKVDKARKVSLRDCSGLEFSNGVIMMGDVYFLHQENSGQQQFDYLSGNLRISSDNIEKFNSNLRRNKKLSLELGFSYSHVVFPAKAVIYKDDFKELGVDISSLLSYKHDQDHVIYPTLKKIHYDINDTHLNDEGMLEVITQLRDVLGFSDLPDAIWKVFSKRGDLGAMIGENSKTCTSKRFVGFKNEPNHATRHYSLQNALEGNTGHLDFLFNPYALTNKRIVLFGDSFFKSRVHVFSSMFTEVIYFRIPYILEDVVRALCPDIVLTGNAERYLTNVPDAYNPAPWFLNYISARFDSSKLDDRSRLAFASLFSSATSQHYETEFKTKAKTFSRYEKSVSNISVHDVKTLGDAHYLKYLAKQLEKVDVKKAIGILYAVKASGKDKSNLDEVIADLESRL